MFLKEHDIWEILFYPVLRQVLEFLCKMATGWGFFHSFFFFFGNVHISSEIFLWIFSSYMVNLQKIYRKLCSVSINLQLCGMSYKWNATVDKLSRQDHAQVVKDHVQVWVEGVKQPELLQLYFPCSGELSLGKITTTAGWAPSSERTVFQGEHVITC